MTAPQRSLTAPQSDQGSRAGQIIKHLRCKDKAIPPDSKDATQD